MTRLRLSLCLCLLPLACSDDVPGDGGETTTNSSETSEAEAEDGDETPGETETETETGDDDPPNHCANCAPDELCVAWANDFCTEEFGYTLACLPADSEEICSSSESAPPCGSVEGVDRWCSNWPSPHCDPIAQDCPEGEKCVPYESAGVGYDAAKCVPIMGLQGVGEPCVHDGPLAATDDCDETSLCVPADALASCDGDACCASFCETTDPRACAAPEECVAWYERGQAPAGVETFGVCMLP